MAMGQQKDRQGDLMIGWSEMPRSPGHAFYDRLQTLLKEAGFDAFVEDICKPYYAPKMGAPSLPPGRYFRMHVVGYFEGIDSERGIVWRCSDSFSLRDFLRLATRDTVPDHSWLSKTRSRLPHEVHEKVFGWILHLVAERGLVKGHRIGVDGSTMEANAALRTIVRRDSGETYREMLRQMAKESGVETPSIDDLIRQDRKRKGKKLSNADWRSKTDPDAKITRMKDGTTHLAYKPEHAVDLDTGVIVAAPIHPADEGDTTSLPRTLEAAACNLAEVDLAPTRTEPCVLVGDKGYHSRDGLKELDGGVWKTRISEPDPAKGYLRWHGDEAARRAVYANRARLKSGVGRDAMHKRGEMVERSFAHVLDRGGMRRAWLRGRENVHKRYLIHVAGFNLGILMRALFGRGTPREAASVRNANLFVIQSDVALAITIVANIEGKAAMLAITIAPETDCSKSDLITGLISSLQSVLESARYGSVWSPYMQLRARRDPSAKPAVLIFGLPRRPTCFFLLHCAKEGGSSDAPFLNRFAVRLPRLQCRDAG
jgi:transposase